MNNIKLPTVPALIGFAIIYASFVVLQKHVMPIPVVGKYLPGGQ